MGKDELVIEADGFLQGKDGLEVGSGGDLESVSQGSEIMVEVRRALILWELLEPMLLVTKLPSEETINRTGDSGNLMMDKFYSGIGYPSLVKGGEKVGKVFASVAVVGKLKHPVGLQERDVVAGVVELRWIH